MRLLMTLITKVMANAFMQQIDPANMREFLNNTSQDYYDPMHNQPFLWDEEKHGIYQIDSYPDGREHPLYLVYYQ